MSEKSRTSREPSISLREPVLYIIDDELLFARVGKGTSGQTEGESAAPASAPSSVEWPDSGSIGESLKES